MTVHKNPAIALFALFSFACSDSGNVSCSGTMIKVPEGQGFTVPELMAHAAAMGMTQKEAETLIYLEGLSPQATLGAGETLCLDGRPDLKRIANPRKTCC